MNLQESIRKILREETEDGMKDIMFDIFDENTKGAELYKYDNSLWMILPEQKEWVIEIDIDLTLWYNYRFFKKIYKYVSLDAIDNQHYITEWVEDILKTGIIGTVGCNQLSPFEVEDIIKTGIRHTRKYGFESRFAVEDIIKKGKKG